MWEETSGHITITITSLYSEGIHQYFEGIHPFENEVLIESNP